MAFRCSACVESQYRLSCFRYSSEIPDILKIGQRGNAQTVVAAQAGNGLSTSLSRGDGIVNPSHAPAGTLSVGHATAHAGRVARVYSSALMPPGSTGRRGCPQSVHHSIRSACSDRPVCIEGCQ